MGLADVLVNFQTKMDGAVVSNLQLLVLLFYKVLNVPEKADGSSATKSRKTRGVTARRRIR
jgi:hypothetical protein